MAILEVKGIKKSFGKTEVLKGIDFEVEKGEVLAIIGSSGSGKTTLLRCLNFLEFADAGTITVSGETLYEGGKSNKEAEKDIRKKRLHFGLVFQSFNLFPQYTVLGNVMLAPGLLVEENAKKQRAEDEAAKFAALKAAGKKGLEAAYLMLRYRLSAVNRKKYKALKAQAKQDIRDKALTNIKRVGLTDKVSAYPHQLSGGQCQRVAIARALALNPDVLCFDEPTSALDPELTGEVLKVIKNLKSADSTMIVVTHEMQFARDVADKVIYMYDGKIEEMGTPEEVFGSPKSERTQQFLKKFSESEVI